MPQRNVTITPRQDAFIEAALKSGIYGNVSEIFRAALRLLEREERQRVIEEELVNRKIQQGVDDIAAGRYTVVHNSDELSAFFRDMRAERQALSED